MGKSQSHPKNKGFSLLETLIAISILSIGMLSVALLLMRSTASASTSRYMSTQSLLASEKLDDLNSLSASDPEIAVPVGTTAGSLTADTTANVAGVTVDYFDRIQIAGTNGSVAETKTGLDAGGNTTYTTTAHTPNGVITQSAPAAAAPVPGPDTIIFSRRWIIEKDTPIPGTRRITVIVTPANIPNSVPFQMSMVRQ